MSMKSWARKLFARPAAPITRARLGQDGLSLDGRIVPTVFASYSVVDDHATWFEAKVSLTNDGPTAVPFDSLQFTLPSSVTAVWDAKQTGHYRDSYTVTNGGWNAAIPAGGSVSFGFTADTGRSEAASGFSLGGVALTDPRLSYTTTGDWGGSMNGQITIHNTGSTPLTDWRLGFDFPGVIDSMWNGTQLSRSGNRVEVGPAWYNTTIPAGGSVQVGFSAHPSGLSATNLTLSTAVAAPPANRPPTAGGDSATTTAGTPVSVSVLANDSDPDGDALSVTAVGTPAHGTAVRNPNNTVTYTPTAGYSGADSFTYTVSDGRGGTAAGTVTVQVTPPVSPPPPAAPSSWPGHVFAPYVDVSQPDKQGQFIDLAAVSRASGVKYLTLGFVVADTGDPSHGPSWGGFHDYAITGSGSGWFDAAMRNKVTALRAAGGDVSVSFGGANGSELATKIDDPTLLTNAYRSVIQAYGATHIDFDIEGAAAETDTQAKRDAIDRRSQAIAVLQQEAAAAGKELRVGFTLQVSASGLNADGMYILQSAKNAGVRVDLVNVMAMDYGQGNVAPGQMGETAIAAATSLYGNLGTLYGSSLTADQKWGMIGVTAMIGQNDTADEAFDLEDARQLEAWAADPQHHIGQLAVWSINRDHYDPANPAGRTNPDGSGKVDPNSSGLSEADYGFSNIFTPFVG